MQKKTGHVNLLQIYRFATISLDIIPDVVDFESFLVVVVES